MLLVLRDALTSHQPLVHVGSKLPFIISNLLHPISKRAGGIHERLELDLQMSYRTTPKQHTNQHRAKVNQCLCRTPVRGCLGVYPHWQPGDSQCNTQLQDKRCW